MKTSRQLNECGVFSGFEISNAFFSSRAIAGFVARVPGTAVTQTRRWSSADEVHVRFNFQGVRFVIWEPYGDNSRLWVGPDEAEASDPIVISELRCAFESTSRWRFFA